MKTKMTIDTRASNGFINDLARRTGASREVVLEKEAGRVLGRAVKYTRKASIKQIQRNARKKAERQLKNYSEAGAGDKAEANPPYISITGKAAWLVIKARSGDLRYIKADKLGGMGDARYNRFLKLNDAREGALKKEVAEAVAAAKKARGLSAQEWVNIGKELGIRVDAPGYVQSAREAAGKTFNSARGRRGVSGQASYIEIASSMRLLAVDLDGQAVLTRAMKAGVSAFAKDIRFKVFDDARKAAARYPGIVVRP